MRTLIASASLLTWLAASAAFAATSPAGDCIAYSDTGMKGQSAAIVRGADFQKGMTQLPFAAKSFFFADGSAVKVFDQPFYQGNPRITAVDHYSGVIHAVPGGNYVDLDQMYLDKAASFACAANGKMWSQLGAFHEKDLMTGRTYDESAHYYNGIVFSSLGSLSIYPHGKDSTVTVEDKGGKKLLTWADDRYEEVSTSGTLDLDSGELTIKAYDAFQPKNLHSTQTVYPSTNTAEIDLQYSGALQIVIEVLDKVMKNDSGNFLTNYYPIQNLELSEIRNVLYGRMVTR